MARIIRERLHLPIEEVKTRMKNDSRLWCKDRFLIIYNALVDPREARDIAKYTGVSVSTVHNIVSTYNRLGAITMETPGKGGRRSEYLTIEAEGTLSLRTTARFTQLTRAQVKEKLKILKG